MKISKVIRGILATAAVLMMGVTVWAQAGGGGMGMRSGPMMRNRPPLERAFGMHGQAGRWWNNPKVVAKFKLTETQRKEMDTILLQHREKLIDLRATLQKAELELGSMIREEQPNETKILAQIDIVAQARANLEKANARFLLALRNILTPAQRKLLLTEWTSSHPNWPLNGKGMNRRGGRQGGMMGGRMGGRMMNNPPGPAQPNTPAPAQPTAPKNTGTSSAPQK